VRLDGDRFVVDKSENFSSRLYRIFFSLMRRGRGEASRSVGLSSTVFWLPCFLFVAPAGADCERGSLIDGPAPGLARVRIEQNLNRASDSAGLYAFCKTLLAVWTAIVA
jgi:hypothetical protein